MAMSRGEVESAVGRELTGVSRHVRRRRRRFPWLAFTGPVVVVPTMLSFSSGPRTTWAGRLPIAVLATGVGFVCGWLLTVVGLGVC